MMHQIRKMVAMAAMVVRCGTPLERITESFGCDPISIPKAPGLGLLLERPVFDVYNAIAEKNFQRPPLDFGKYEKEIDEFKQKEIYERIFRVEEKENQFHVFFHNTDNFPTEYFLWVTATGIPASKQALDKGKKSEAVLDALGLGAEGEADVVANAADGAVEEG